MEALTIAFKLHDGINFYWNFYVVFGVAVLGWVFSRKAPWAMVQRVTIAIAFVSFVVINLLALVKSYRALDSVLNALRTTPIPTLPPGVQSATIDRLAQPLWRAAIVIHILMDFVILYFISRWSGRKVAT